MELKAGYKQTEVGVIPEDWVVRPIGSFSSIFGRIGFRGYTKKDIVKEGQGAIALNPSNIQESKLVLNRCTYVTWEKYHQSPEIKIQQGDVILVKTGSTIGKTCYVDCLPIEATLNPQMVVFKNFSVDPKLVSYIFSSPVFQNQITATVVGGALPTLSQKQVTGYEIPLPPAEIEQRAIATALSDVDALLESLDQLINKKRNLKQAAMQELLTGKTRLPGFDGEWDVQRLGDIVDIRSGGTPSTTNAAFWDGGVPWCTPTDITALLGKKYLSDTERTISDAGLRASSAEVIPPNSIIMTSRATIGECAINTVPMTTNQGFKNLIPLKADPEFLYYLMTTQKDRLKQLCGGSTFLEIGKKQLQRFEIVYPLEADEQTAIAQVLSDMDAEIAALEQRRKKTRDLKQAMMQELLTGKTRLV